MWGPKKSHTPSLSQWASGPLGPNQGWDSAGWTREWRIQRLWAPQWAWKVCSCTHDQGGCSDCQMQVGAGPLSTLHNTLSVGLRPRAGWPVAPAALLDGSSGGGKKAPPSPGAATEQDSTEGRQPARHASAVGAATERCGRGGARRGMRVSRGPA